MSLKDIWVDLEDKVQGDPDSGSDISVEPINMIAHAVIDNEINLDGKVSKENGKGLSSNDYTNGDKTRVENSMQFKGEVEETALPTENSVKGDVYKLLKPIAKSYIASSIRYDENVGCYIFFANQYTGLYTTEEYNYMINSNYGAGYFGPEVSCDVYDNDWKYICTKPMSYRDDCGYWCMGDKGELIEGVNYNIVRSDDVVVMDSELNTHEFLVDADSYAIYNGESFDKFYNEETVDNKIAEVEEDCKNEIENAKRWKTLIDTTLTEEQGGVSSIKIEIPEPEMLKTITRMRILVDIQTGDEGIPSQLAKILIGDYNVNSYNCFLGWNTVKCDANKKLMYRGITEFLPIDNNSTVKSRNTITFYSAPTIYDNVNANGNAIKIPSYLNTNLYNIRPPYFQVVLSDGGIMVAGTRIFVEVFE